MEERHKFQAVTIQYKSETSFGFRLMLVPLKLPYYHSVCIIMLTRILSSFILLRLKNRNLYYSKRQESHYDYICMKYHNTKLDSKA